MAMIRSADLIPRSSLPELHREAAERTGFYNVQGFIHNAPRELIAISTGGHCG